MRVLVALDTSEIGETAAIAMAVWSRSVPMEIHVLSVVHTDDLHASRESASFGEFAIPAGTVPGLISSDVAPAGDPLPMIVEYRGQAIEGARSEREDYLRTVVARHLQGTSATVRVELSDQTADTIVETAKSLGVDAIAMGTHGKSGIRHALVGSVTEQVIRQSPVPVVLIGPGAHAALRP
ncbi:MAG TPA: universal stress protein [Tepidiformaceae bacterium]